MHQLIICEHLLLCSHFLALVDCTAISLVVLSSSPRDDLVPQNEQVAIGDLGVHRVHSLLQVGARGFHFAEFAFTVQNRLILPPNHTKLAMNKEMR